MAVDFTQLRSDIVASIRQNGAQLITGQLLQDRLLEMVNEMETAFNNFDPGGGGGGGETTVARGTFIGTLNTAKSTADKVVNAAGFTADDLVQGTQLVVLCTSSNTATNITLNVSSTGAKQAYMTAYNGDGFDFAWGQYEILEFVYDGSAWRMTNKTKPTGKIAGNVKVVTSLAELLSATNLDNTMTITAATAKEIYNNAGGGGGGGSYSAGTGIDIYGSTISLKRATASAIGGVKPAAVRSTDVSSSSISTGTSVSGRYYGLEINSDGLAYVNVPWSSGSGGGGGAVSSVAGYTGDVTAQQIYDQLRFVTPAVSYRNGTTAGPVIEVTTDGGSDTATIPSASGTQSGVVTTGAQTLAGDKTLTGDTTVQRLYFGNSGNTETYIEYDQNADAIRIHGNMYTDGYSGAGGVASAGSGSAVLTDTVQTITGAKTFSAPVTISGSNYLKIGDGKINYSSGVFGVDSDLNVDGELSVDAGADITGDVRASGAMYATAFNQTSDVRLKENIVPLQDALGVLSRLNPVEFDWKSNGDHSYGFVAQEMKGVLPEAVSGEKMLSVNYAMVIPYLVRAVQQLSERVKQLEG